MQMYIAHLYWKCTQHVCTAQHIDNLHIVTALKNAHILTIKHIDNVYVHSTSALHSTLTIDLSTRCRRQCRALTNCSEVTADKLYGRPATELQVNKQNPHSVEIWSSLITEQGSIRTCKNIFHFSTTLSMTTSLVSSPLIKPVQERCVNSYDTRVQIHWPLAWVKN